MAYKPDKHGRDHCPGGEDPIPCLVEPWVALGGGATTAPDGVTMPVPFQTIAYDPTLVTQGVIFDWDIDDTGDPGNDRYEIRSVIAGWYRFELITTWDQTTSPGGDDHGYAQMAITFDSNIGFPFDENLPRASADWLDNNYAPDGFEMVANPTLRLYGRIFVPANRTWQPRAEQVTGVDRGLSGDLFRLWFIKPDVPSSWTFDAV